MCSMEQRTNNFSLTPREVTKNMVSKYEHTRRVRRRRPNKNAMSLSLL